MQNVATLASASFRQPQQPEADAANRLAVKNLFLLMQGFYGTLFLSKFCTGVLDSEKRDLGIRAAMAVWRSQLAKYAPGVIEQAAEKMAHDHPDFPPNLPQFEAICRALTPRKTHAELHGYAMLPAPKLERMNVSIEPLGDGRDWARKIKARHEAGDKTVTPGVYRSALQALGGGQ